MNERYVEYIAWQDKSLQFYLAARLLFFHEQYGPALISGHHGLALLMRATLLHWDEHFNPESNILEVAGMVRVIRRQVTGASDFRVPQYLCAVKLSDPSELGDNTLSR
jgi:hypothetical protein